MDLNPKGPELYKLVKDPKQELPRTLTSGDPRLQQLTYGDNTILHVAANFKNTKAATKILDLDRSLLCKTNKKGDTPMHIAARLGCSEMVELLIKCANEDVEQGRKLLTTVNLEKDTALHVAVRKGHLGIVKLLIQEDKTLAMMINEAKESPLFLAVDREFYKIALEILKFECSVQGRKNMNALHAAVIRTHKTIFDLVIEGNRFKTKHESTLLKIASRIKRFIIDQITRNCSAVDRNVNIKRTDFVQKVMDKSEPTEADDFGWIPLHYAAHLGDKELVKLFLENEKSLAYITDNEGMSALHISAKKGHVGVMREIIEKCPDTCELLDKRSRTALHLSVESGLMEPVGFLLGRPEFDNLINERDQEGNTLLHLAATRGYVLTEVLLLYFKKVDRVILNNKDMSTLDILRSATQQNILLWLVEEMPLEPLFHFIRYHIGYLPSLEGVAISEIKEAHDQETGNEPSSEGEGKVESSTAKIEGNDDEKEKHVALPPNLKAPESVHKEEYSNEILASISLTIATIIATVTFQAACQIPGGYQNNGQPNLSLNSSFRAFLLYDSVSFGLSAFLMCFHFVVAIFPRYFHIPYPRLLIFILSELSLMSMIAAFISIINTQNSATDAVNMGTYLAFFIPFFPFLLVFYAHFCVKHISKYRFPFFSSSFRARH